jgi:hypothetical protein
LFFFGGGEWGQKLCDQKGVTQFCSKKKTELLFFVKRFTAVFHKQGKLCFSIKTNSKSLDKKKAIFVSFVFFYCRIQLLFDYKLLRIFPPKKFVTKN